MRISVYFAPDKVDRGELAGAAAVVIDVVRATSCIVEAVANGARAVHPVVSVEEAFRLRESLGADTLLCGERRGLRIDGFDLGNSPAEFSRAAVAGKRLVMTTTNGTRAFAAAATADQVFTASFHNQTAVVAALPGDGAVVVVCAGKEGRFSLDDTVCAGIIVRGLCDRVNGPVRLNDGAAAAGDLAGIHPVTGGMLAATAAGKALVDVGLGSDLALCARADRHQIVPMMYDGVITAPRG
ncbi:MAG: 2-phosphosulfolactate phosphatase [Gemmatimonadetes bacterium]|nr:2-phosphosulfolactate phosphatase [Gemmatimonadota bacterium]MCY3679477.1 2-phosphosulfolactate phosphatase [Gemmatimonadota bacterium]MYA41985.1 2-phosphosulfolactate phosphatase [Gemmatimonadota bacterium]MYE94902.1 2-phosphosulfolactate phosphatase [Gemmatimonadota bacterium]MYJ11756.1 2-phosphosulfolactate phosphatase [Gemmatimonadota bacterium]